ncbi:MerR family transcriptional regulator [Alkalibaculum sp. M08DMB]|uniref:MerR family transcriptional regulator n=1 Tax=Alkalibaculum sporogenes TaxID=2655001 RepID=A0A6A7K7E2_9FIRM|nr:MerR family transcriptional regulator [Alkalibaculum sporogenes]MPW25251.1 MerR family transcriptional regulator [Alkalibaculum sporogenes]
MENTYKTAQVSKIFGVHPNTVRLYEKFGLIPKTQRLSNGYRVFTDFHIEQFKLARIGLKVEVLQSGLRKKIIHIIKLSAKREFQEAITCTNEYIKQVKIEQRNAEEAIDITDRLLSGIQEEEFNMCLTRKQTSQYVQVTMDTLRNWEMNGLLIVKRKENGYRIYSDEDIKRLKIIRTLRCANYSLQSILRMLNELSDNSKINIKKVLDTPQKSDDILSVCDMLITSLQVAESNAHNMLVCIDSMKNKY